MPRKTQNPIVVIDTRGFDCGHCGKPIIGFFKEWSNDISGKKNPRTPSIDMCLCGRDMCRRCNIRLNGKCSHINTRRAQLLADTVVKALRLSLSTRRRTSLESALHARLLDPTHFGIWHALHEDEPKRPRLSRRKKKKKPSTQRRLNSSGETHRSTPWQSYPHG